MLYLFYGEDDFSLGQAVQELQKSQGLGDLAGLNTTRLAARGLALESLTGYCDAVPFLAEGRLVVVDGLLSLFEGRVVGRRGRGAPPPAPPGLGPWTALPDYIRRMPPTTSLVLADGPLQGQNPLLSALRPLARVRPFPSLREAALQTWVRRRVVEGSGEIEGPALRHLVETIGSNLWVLNGEVEKLLLYCQGRLITQDDVLRLVGYVKEGNIFALADAIVEGRYTEGRLQLRRLMEEGIGAAQVLAVLARQVRLLLQAQDLLEHGEARLQIQRALGLRSDFALDKTISQARLFSLAELMAMHRSLLERDLDIKTGRLSDEIALELLLSDAAERAKRP